MIENPIVGKMYRTKVWSWKDIEYVGSVYHEGKNIHLGREAVPQGYGQLRIIHLEDMQHLDVEHSFSACTQEVDAAVLCTLAGESACCSEVPDVAEPWVEETPVKRDRKKGSPLKNTHTADDVAGWLQASEVASTIGICCTTLRRLTALGDIPHRIAPSRKGGNPAYYYPSVVGAAKAILKSNEHIPHVRNVAAAYLEGLRQTAKELDA